MLVYPEGRAALAAARRSDRLGKKGHARALADFEALVSELALIGVDESLARSAGALAEEFELRGYDAMHLSTALALGEDVAALVTWDGDLAEAAIEAGLPIAPA
jgi:predicted nucleic acid-binding protein